MHCIIIQLPKVTLMYKNLMNDYWSSDKDYGKMFSNFPMHKSGVYLDDFNEENKDY